MNKEIWVGDNQIVLTSMFVSKKGLPYVKHTVSNAIKQIEGFEKTLYHAMGEVDITAEKNYLKNELLIMFKTKIDTERNVISTDEIDYVSIDISNLYETEDFKELSKEMETVKFSELSQKNLTYLVNLLGIESLI